MALGQSWRLGLFFLGLSAAVWTLPARAADDPDPKTTPPATGKAEASRGAMAFLDRFKAAIDGVKLSEEQQKQADALFSTARKDLKALTDKADAAELRQKAHDLFEKLRKDVSPLLNEEQRAEVAKKLQPPGPGVIIDKIKQQLAKPELKLTEEQRKQAGEVLDETKHKLEELRADATTGGKDVRAKLRDILQEMREKLTKVLSPEQLDGIGTPKAPPPAKPDAGAPTSK